MWRTVGHERAVRTFQRSLSEDRLAHGYLLLGPANVGKTTLALELAQAVNCLAENKPCGECVQCQRIAAGKHADVKIITRDVLSKEGRERTKSEIGIDQVRDVQRSASLSPYEGKCSVFIFEGVQYLSQEAANSLLKTLEEPPAHVLLILLSDEKEEALTPTIVSRCQVIELSPLPASLVIKTLKDRWAAEPSKAEELSRLSGGRIGWAVRALTEPGFLEPRNERLRRILALMGSGLEERFDYAAEVSLQFGRKRESVREEMELWLSVMRDLLMLKEGVAGVITNLSIAGLLESLAPQISTTGIMDGAKAVETTWHNLEQNANPRLALESLMLALPIVEVKETMHQKIGDPA